MLRLRLRVTEVREDLHSIDHIIVYAVIESDTSNEMRIPVAQSEEQRFGEEIGKSIQSTLAVIGMPMPRRKPIESAVSFYITKQQYFAMGKPSVTDYIQVESFRAR